MKISLASIKDKINEKSLVVGVAMTMPAVAYADSPFTSATSEVESKFDAGETALSAVFASTIEIYVIRRVWRIIRSSI